MKVLMINTLGLQTGGITISMLNYIKNIRRDKIQIDITSTMKFDQEMVDQFKENKCKIYYLRHRKSDLIGYLKDLYDVLKNNQYDIVHVHGNSATITFELAIAFIAGVKIRIAHSHNTTCDHKKMDKILRPFFYLLCNGRFACGKDAGKWLFGKRRFEIIYNGIDIDKFKYDVTFRKRIKKELDIDDDAVLLGNIGNLNTQKNQNYLLKIMKNLTTKSQRNYKLIIIGKGELEQILKKQTKELGLEESVNFVGQINNVNEYLSALDCMIMPSLYEGFPVTLVEAQVSGLKCLISDNITEEVMATDLIKRLSLDKSSEWIRNITEMKYVDNREKYYEIMHKKGFTIIENAQKLEHQYIKLFNI